VTRPYEFDDVKRVEAIKGRLRLLCDERTEKGDGSVVPTRECLKAAAEQVVFNDVEWLLTKIEGNWG
jgi:hypothetical protein